MAAGNLPIFTSTPDVSTNNSTTPGGSITTATGDYTGVSANHVLEHTAGANGSYVRKLRFVALGTNVATVARIYLNNGSSHTSASNNVPYGQLSLPATTASNTTATPDADYSMEIALPAGWTIWVGLGTTVAAGWSCVAVAGQY